MKKGDLLIYLAALALAALPLLMLLAPKPAPACAVVRIDGSEVHRFSLEADAQRTFSTAHGNNTVQVHNGQVRMLSADCPDGTCVSMGFISRANETLVCLPHHLTVTLEGADASAPDAVTQ